MIFPGVFRDFSRGNIFSRFFSGFSGFPGFVGHPVFSCILVCYRYIIKCKIRVCQFWANGEMAIFGILTHILE